MNKNKQFEEEYKGEGGENMDQSAESANVNESVELNDDFAGETEDTQAEQEVNTLENQLVELQDQLDKEKKEYLFLMAEFDNFRKRTLKEKSELIKNGGESALKGLLPILDDFERGIAASENDESAASVLEGMKLIYSKFKKYLESNGVKEMESTGAEFNADLHEAIARVPAQSEDQKGKVIDTVQKGYMINDKVLRHAKVAVAQ